MGVSTVASNTADCVISAFLIFCFTRLVISSRTSRLLSLFLRGRGNSLLFSILLRTNPLFLLFSVLSSLVALIFHFSCLFMARYSWVAVFGHLQLHFQNLLSTFRFFDHHLLCPVLVRRPALTYSGGVPMDILGGTRLNVLWLPPSAHCNSTAADNMEYQGAALSNLPCVCTADGRICVRLVPCSTSGSARVDCTLLLLAVHTTPSPFLRYLISVRPEPFALALRTTSI